MPCHSLFDKRRKSGTVTQGQLLGSGTALEAELFLTCHQQEPYIKRVCLRGSPYCGLVFPFHTLGCTEAWSVGNKDSCDSDGGKNIEEEGGHEKGEPLLIQPFSLSTSESNDVCLLRRICGHCANIEAGGVMNVSAWELRSTEVRKVSLSLVVSGYSMHTSPVTSQ